MRGGFTDGLRLDHGLCSRYAYWRRPAIRPDMRARYRTFGIAERILHNLPPSGYEVPLVGAGRAGLPHPQEPCPSDRLELVPPCRESFMGSRLFSCSPPRYAEGPGKNRTCRRYWRNLHSRYHKRAAFRKHKKQHKKRCEQPGRAASGNVEWRSLSGNITIHPRQRRRGTTLMLPASLAYNLLNLFFDNGPNRMKLVHMFQGLTPANDKSFGGAPAAAQPCQAPPQAEGKPNEEK
jgi:hypothetical protein